MTVIAGIDIGSHSISTLIGEGLPGGGVRIRGAGHAPAEGIRSGEVVHVEDAASAIGASLERAERLAGDGFDMAVVGITGAHIDCLNNRASVPCGRRPRRILAADVDRVLEAAGSIPIADGREVLHVLPRGYRLDGGHTVDSPVGMEGSRLEADVHVVGASAGALSAIRRCLDLAEVGPARLALSTLAAAEATLDRDEKELGVVVVDLGHAVTGVACYSEGSLVHSAVLPIGGRHMTNDLAIFLQTPLEQAERIKQTHGHVLPEHDEDRAEVEVVPFGTDEPIKVSRRLIGEVLAARADEIARMVGEALDDAALEDRPPAGVVLVGGGAELNGLPRRLGDAWGMPVRRGRPTQIAGLASAAGTPAHAAAVGLIMWAAREVRDAATPVTSSGRSSGEPGGMLDWVRSALLPRRGT